MLTEEAIVIPFEIPLSQLAVSGPEMKYHGQLLIFLLNLGHDKPVVLKKLRALLVHGHALTGQGSAALVQKVLKLEDDSFGSDFPEDGFTVLGIADDRICPQAAEPGIEHFHQIGLGP